MDATYTSPPRGLATVPCAAAHASTEPRQRLQETVPFLDVISRVAFVLLPVNWHPTPIQVASSCFLVNLQRVTIGLIPIEQLNQEVCLRGLNVVRC